MSPAELLEQWRFRNHRVQLAQYESARLFDRLHLWLGLPAIVLSAIVGTTIFASMSKTADVSVQITVGLLSVAAAILTGLQTFLKYSELSEKHRMAGAKFANLKHPIELLAIFPPATNEEFSSKLVAIEESWSKIREESPTLPNRIWQKIEKSVFSDQTK